jgi:hypothetical protein
MTNVADKNQNTHIIFNIYFLNRAVYEIMWKNMADPEGQQMTIYEYMAQQKMGFSCPIT